MSMALASACTSAKPTAPSSPTAVATKRVCGLDDINLAARSVVRLETSEATGSGFLLADGTVVTNAHVVGTSLSATIQFADGGSTEADVVGISDQFDIA